MYVDQLNSVSVKWPRRMHGTKKHDCETLTLYGSNLKAISICNSGDYTQKGITNTWGQGSGGRGGAQSGAAAQQGSEKYAEISILN